MIKDLPFFVSIIFGLTALATLGILVLAIARSSQQRTRSNAKLWALAMLAWMVLHSVLAYAGFYTESFSAPPRYLLAAGPPFLFIAGIFLTRRGRGFVQSLPLNIITQLHVVRVPAEATFYMLYLYGIVPEVMTFEGRNLDIFSGLSAPVVSYFAFSANKMGYRWLLVWNIITLLLLLNIMVNSAISTPYPFQQQAFGHPNMAVFYFPFILLPAFIGPVVLFCQLAGISKIVRKLREG